MNDSNSDYQNDTKKHHTNDFVITSSDEKHLKSIRESQKFQLWLDRIMKEFPELNHINVETVLKFKEQLGFAFINHTNLDIPSAVFFRGPAVSIFPLIQTTDKKIYTILIVQARFPAARKNYVELPSGMVDSGGNFSGAASRELEEETGIKINNNDLLDLINCFDKNTPGAFPSAGGCDEFLRFYVSFSINVPKEKLIHLVSIEHGLVTEREKIRLIPIEITDFFKTKIFPDYGLKLVIHDVGFHTALNMIIQILLRLNINSFDEFHSWFISLPEESAQSK